MPARACRPVGASAPGTDIWSGGTPPDGSTSYPTRPGSPANPNRDERQSREAPDGQRAGLEAARQKRPHPGNARRAGRSWPEIAVALGLDADPTTWPEISAALAT